MQAVRLQRSNVRRIGIQTIFGDNQFEMGMILTQFGDQALSGVTLPVRSRTKRASADKCLRTVGAWVAIAW